MGRAVIIAAKADMLVGKLLEVKCPVRLVMETLVEEAVHPLGRGIAQTHAQIIIERLEVSGLEALKDNLVPEDKRGKQVELVARRAAVVKLKSLNDMKSF